MPANLGNAGRQHPQAERVSCVAHYLGQTGSLYEAIQHAISSRDGTCKPTEDELVRLSMVTMNPVLPHVVRFMFIQLISMELTIEEVAETFGTTTDETVARLESACTLAVKLRRGVPTYPADSDEFRQVMTAFLDTLAVTYDEGYQGRQAMSSSPTSLAAQALNVARFSLEKSPETPDVRALLSVILFKEARRAARTTDSSVLESSWLQDRSTWDRSMIDEAHFHALRVRSAPPSRFTLTAEIEDLICTADSDDDVNWDRVLACYTQLCAMVDREDYRAGRLLTLGRVRGQNAALNELTYTQFSPTTRKTVEDELSRLSS